MKIGRISERLAILALVALLIAPNAGKAEDAVTSGAVMFLPGPLGALHGDPEGAVAGGPTGWHIPGKEFKAGSDWWALTCTKTCELSPTRLAVSPATHNVYDGDPLPSQLLHWEPLPYGLDKVATENAQPDAALVMVFRLAGSSSVLKLAAGQVKTWWHPGMEAKAASGRIGTMETNIPLDSGEAAMIVPRLFKVDAKKSESSEDSLSLQLRIGKRRQSLGDYSFDIEGMVPIRSQDYLHWAGDLDGDGKLDLLMSFAGRWNDDVLFLSSLAREGELVGEAGRFRYSDPSDSGC